MTKRADPDSLPWHRRILYGLTNWGLFSAGLANLAIGAWAAINVMATVAATSLTAGLVLLFASTIDRFESLKGLGVEAKTRRLDQKIDQADDALRSLREMTEITGAALVDPNSKMGRLGSAPGPRESIALAERVRTIMNTLGSDQRTVAIALRPWARTLCFDMALAQTKGLSTLIRTRIESLQAERKQIQQPIQPDEPVFTRISAQIEALLEF